MRSCPQCRSRFGEEYFFCLNDGVRLIDDAGEQITFVAPARIRQACAKCGAGNDADAIFCSKCGASVTMPSVVTEATKRTVSAPLKRSAPLPTFLADAADEPVSDERARLVNLLLLVAITILGLFLIAMLIDNG